MSDWLFSDRKGCRADSIYPLLCGAILAGLSAPGKAIAGALICAVILEALYVVWRFWK